MAEASCAGVAAEAEVELSLPHFLAKSAIMPPDSEEVPKSHFFVVAAASDEAAVPLEEKPTSHFCAMSDMPSVIGV